MNTDRTRSGFATRNLMRPDLTRRAFVQATTIAVGGLALGSCRLDEGAAPTPLRILILGGTNFIGPHQVRAAVERGHEVTLFNRGRTNPDLFPDLETLIGDRDGDLGALAGREWDVVIDNPANIPRWVRLSAEALRGSVGKYVFVSSTGVYIPYLTTDIHEDAPVDTIDDPETEEVNGRTFGALKALAEDEARSAFPDDHLIVRPTYIIGPGDTSDRFTYWPVRLARGGEVLAPGDPGDPMQHVDARDLGAFMIRAVEDDLTGTMNIVGPPEGLTMGSLLERTRAAVGSDAMLTWVDAAFLQEHGVGALTYWTEPAGDYLGMMQVNGDKAFAAGFEMRPLEQTAVETLEWWNAQDAQRQELQSGLTPEREAELLAAFRGEGHVPVI
ncbi:MAG: twin-arginine translocation signal domain-containing protein [Gemmatimonadetes bacterium]|nr:twin-arginine translocation signal domain-containing protein [Gemmatimonadota bacterium]